MNVTFLIPWFPIDFDGQLSVWVIDDNSVIVLLYINVTKC